MFSKAILTTPLTDDMAYRLFASITALNVPDQSFLATLRALLHKRLMQHETAKITVHSLYMSGESMEAASLAAKMDNIIPNEVNHPSGSEHNVFIVYNTFSPEAGAKMLEVVRSNVGVGKGYMANYTKREDLRVFYARKVNALFYTDDSRRNTVIFTERLDLKQFHALQMMVPKYLPLPFADVPLTETETALLKSTGNKSAVDYEALIGGFAKALDIRAEVIRSKLAGFETVYERTRIGELKNIIARYQNDYDGHMSSLRNLAREIQERQYVLAGLECAVNKRMEDSELMEYFMCNKNLSLVRVDGNWMEFVAHGYADVYDSEAFEQYVGNHNGYMYGNLCPGVTAGRMERLYRAIFGEGTYRLRICAAYTVDMQNGLKAIKGYSFPPESKTHLPNPHIQNYGCIGTYAVRFHAYMVKRDYVGAIDQAVVSARNLNFYDSTVMGEFAKVLSRSVKKCIEKSDGTLLTPREAITELEGGTVCQDQ